MRQDEGLVEESGHTIHLNQVLDVVLVSETLLRHLDFLPVVQVSLALLAAAPFKAAAKAPVA